MTTKLPKKLQTLLKKIKDTPNDEPEIYEIYKNKTPIDATIEILDLLSKRFDQDLNSLPPQEAAAFVSAVKFRVMGYRDDAGNFKRTKNSVKVEPLRMKEALEITKLIQDDKTDEALAFVEQYVPDDVTDEWERGLIESMLIYGSTDVAKTALGFELGNS